MHIYIYTHTVHKHVCKYTCKHVCMYVCMYVCVYIYALMYNHIAILVVMAQTILGVWIARKASIGLKPRAPGKM